MDKLYKQAAIKQWRYDSIKGQLTVEDLLVIPLDESESKTPGFSLDAVAVALYEAINKKSTTSFTKSVNVENTELNDKLDLIKSIINDRLEIKKNAQEAATKAVKIKQLEALIADKKQEEIKNLSIEDLEANLKALKG